MSDTPVYVCSELSVVNGDTVCKQWVVDTVQQSVIALSQDDSYLIGQWLISFFVLCCIYTIIVKAIKIA